VNIIAAPVEKQQRPQHHGRRPWCHVTPLVTPPELGLQLFHTAAGETMLLVDGTRWFRIHVFEDGGKAFSYIDGFAMVSGAGQTMIAVLHQLRKFQVQSLPLLSQPNIPVAWNQPDQASAGGSGKQSDSIKDSTSSNSKRKAAETNSLAVSGPGHQAGGGPGP
jgi:hypothetical protein